MTALWIILSIAAFFALLLFWPISLTVSYLDSFRAKVRYLFFSFDTEKPVKKKKPKKKSEKPEKEKKERKLSDKIGELKKEKGIKGLIELLKKLLTDVFEAKKWLSHLRLVKFYVHIRLGTEDPAKLAETYGAVCAAVYPVSERLVDAGRCRNYRIRVTPDFATRQSTAKAYLKLRIKPFFLICAAVGILVRVIKTWNQSKITIQSEERGAVS